MGIVLLFLLCIKSVNAEILISQPEAIYNVGDELGNMSKQMVVDILKTKLDFVYNTSEDWKDEDMRDYVVDYSKIKKLGFKCQISIEQGIDEMIKAFKVL